MYRASRLTLLAFTIGCASTPTPGPIGTTQSAQAGTSSIVYANIPTELEGFKLTERATVSGLPADSLFRFSDGSRTILTVIIYGITPDVKIGADSQKWTAREGEKFKLVQELRARRGQISAYEVAFADTATISTGAGSMLESAIGVPVRMPNGSVAVDFQYLYLVHGKFVKVRATVPEQGWQQTPVPNFARNLALRLARGR